MNKIQVSGLEPLSLGEMLGKLGVRVYVLPFKSGNLWGLK
jgi:hypothetical protein